MGGSCGSSIRVVATALVLSKTLPLVVSSTRNSNERRKNFNAHDIRGAARPFHPSSIVQLASATVDKRNDDFKSNREWWLDPLSLFGEDEDEAEQTATPNSEQDETRPELDDVQLPDQQVEEELEELDDVDDRIVQLGQDLPSKTAPDVKTAEPRSPTIVPLEQDLPSESVPDVANDNVPEPRTAPTMVSFAPQISGNAAAVTILVFTAARLFLAGAGPCFVDLQTRMAKPRKSTRAAPKEGNPMSRPKNMKPPQRLASPRESTAEARMEPRPNQEALFGQNSSGPQKVRLPPSRVLNEQLEEMTQLFEDAQAAKEAVEKEYEKTSWQLQETLTELNSLKTTTRHLQAQLADNESVMSRAIRAERRKAKEELLRMRESMVKVVEREREQMREEFMKQASELQVMWKKQQEQQRQYTKYPPSPPPPPRTASIPPNRNNLPSAARRSNEGPP
eukprot:CAMPEP_0168825414 /NCGR_PEP_ID=MMETSP0726-20121227/11622_1 /TAXON_ID=265536 /ORGANISM="Amphiprora sp., Strain CCMP467" /LENGTH=449 /DNA_ID=CAMNT_0008878495 /DNA_START=20 /DNA_END=1370 /DNA_ORIENTATION=+